MFTDSTLQNYKDDLARLRKDLDRTNDSIFKENLKFQDELDRLKIAHTQRLNHLKRESDVIIDRISSQERKVEDRERELQKEADRAK